MFFIPNAMLTNVMACRVFRNAKFGDQRIDPTINPSSGAVVFRKPQAHSSGAHALRLVSGNDNQARGSYWVEGGKLGNAEVIEIYSSHRHLEDRNQGESAV
jgi:hypothetical protein